MTDSDDTPKLRPIQNATDTVSRVKAGVLSWLPSAKVCECGARCEAGHAYDRQQAAFHSETYGKVPAWVCPECGKKYRREASGGLGFDIWDRE